MSSIADNIERVTSEIGDAAVRAGRDPGDVRLVAVTKNVDAGRVNEAVALGVRDLGENRVQEAVDKIPRVGGSPNWHLVGHLQRNKARQVVGIFSLIHSLDSLELAEELDRRSKSSGCVTNTLLQVNISGEASKYGIRPEQAAEFLMAMPRYEHLQVLGLMTIPPYSPDPEGARPVFRAARKLAQELAGLSLSNVRMNELSMGMSGDYRVAVEEGATIVRIGSAIFGPRPSGGV